MPHKHPYGVMLITAIICNLLREYYVLPFLAPQLTITAVYTKIIVTVHYLRFFILFTVKKTIL